MKKNSKTNKIVIISIISLILTISIIIFVLNYTKDSSSFSIIEKISTPFGRLGILPC